MSDEQKKERPDLGAAFIATNKNNAFPLIIFL